MTEDELKKLKNLPVPPPRAEAKAAALAAAMAAFDVGEKESAEKSPDKSQGNDAAGRQTHALNAKRRQKMRAPVIYRIAAGIAVVIVATPAAVYFLNSSALRNAADDSSAPNLVFRERLGKEQSAPTVLDQTTAPVGGALGRRADKKDGTSARPGILPASPDQNAVMRDRDSSGADEAGHAKEKGTTSRLIAKQEADAAETEVQTTVTAPAEPKPSQEFFRFGASNKVGNEAPGDKVQNQVSPDEYRDRFEATKPNPVKQVSQEPVSTFSIDVDTASYSFVRRALNAGRLPPKDAVRVEEMINYFPYDYPGPETAETPFQPTVTVTPAPWKPTDKLVHIGIKGYDLTPAERPRANLVFLIDVSGSMASSDKLPLVKNAFRLLINELQPEDTVGIVTYASGSGVLLEPTQIAEKSKILAAIDALGAGGSTAGAEGIQDAYRLAEANFDKEGVNRIILATDGDFNVGVTNDDELKGLIERKRASGIFLSILGVGQGNYNDTLMQTLAQNGNGTAAYVDTLNEARKVLVDEASSTLFTIAKDVKIQVEFNPMQVSEYRLIGYETRALRREDFNNDKVDAGDIGSGHTVTAIYEVTPVGAPKLVDDLRYRQPQPAAAEPARNDGELGFLKLRYKLPKEETSKLVTVPITAELEKSEISAAPEDVRFSVAVAGFGQLLRGLPYVGGYSYDDVLALAQPARGEDAFGYRSEFLNLVRLAKSARP